MNIRVESIPITEQEVHKGILLPRCQICNQVPAQGIKGGIKIKRAFLCNKCEQELIHIKVGSADYQIMVEKVKQLLK